MQSTGEYQDFNDNYYDTDTELELKPEYTEQQEVTTTKAIPIATFLKTQIKESSGSEISSVV